MSIIKLAESLYLKWARFIVEAKEKEPEAPKSAPFGEFAWAKHREGFSDHKPETELETQTYWPASFYRSPANEVP